MHRYDLAKSQLHCVCAGHRDLVYDLCWVRFPQTEEAQRAKTAGAGGQSRLEELLDDAADLALVSASSDGTAQVFEIPRFAEWGRALAPSAMDSRTMNRVALMGRKRGRRGRCVQV